VEKGFIWGSYMWRRDSYGEVLYGKRILIGKRWAKIGFYCGTPPMKNFLNNVKFKFNCGAFVRLFFSNLQWKFFKRIV